MMWSVAPWWHWLAMVAVWFVILGAAVWAIGRIVPASSRPAPSSARVVLDERLARGELDADQYRHLRELLER